MIASCGAVPFGPSGEPPLFFGARVGDSLLNRWAREGSRQVIGQAEILPVILAKWTWGRLIAGSPILVFIDNDSARFGLVTGTSPSKCSAELLSASARADCMLNCYQWVARVPSWSNIADAPSRLDFEYLEGIRGSCRSALALPDGAFFSWEGATAQLSSEIGGTV